MKTPELGDVLFRRKEDRTPLGFIIKIEDYLGLYFFETQRKQILLEGFVFSGIFMNREEIEKVFPADKNLSIILSLIDRILFLENENTRLKIIIVDNY